MKQLRLLVAVGLCLPHAVGTAFFYPEHLPLNLAAYAVVICGFPHFIRFCALWQIRWAAWNDLRRRKFRMPWKLFMAVTRQLRDEKLPLGGRKEGG